MAPDAAPVSAAEAAVSALLTTVTVNKGGHLLAGLAADQASDGVGLPLVDAHVSARIEAPSGRISKVDFTAEQRDWGLYRATFQPLEAGPHHVTLSCRETGATLSAEVAVTGTALERVGRPARPDVLAELSRVSLSLGVPTAHANRDDLVAVAEVGDGDGDGGAEHCRLEW